MLSEGRWMRSKGGPHLDGHSQRVGSAGRAEDVVRIKIHASRGRLQHVLYTNSI